MGLSGETVAGGGRAVGVLLERAGPERPAEHPVLRRSQLAAVGFLAGDAVRWAAGLWNDCSVFAGRLPMMPAAFLSITESIKFESLREE